MRVFADILRQLAGGRTDDHATDVARVTALDPHILARTFGGAAYRKGQWRATPPEDRNPRHELLFLTRHHPFLMGKRLVFARPRGDDS